MKRETLSRKHSTIDRSPLEPAVAAPTSINLEMTISITPVCETSRRPHGKARAAPSCSLHVRQRATILREPQRGSIESSQKSWVAVRPILQRPVPAVLANQTAEELELVRG